MEPADVTVESADVTVEPADVTAEPADGSHFFGIYETEGWGELIEITRRNYLYSLCIIDVLIMPVN